MPIYVKTQEGKKSIETAGHYFFIALFVRLRISFPSGNTILGVLGQTTFALACVVYDRNFVD